MDSQKYNVPCTNPWNLNPCLESILRGRADAVIQILSAGLFILRKREVPWLPLLFHLPSYSPAARETPMPQHQTRWTRTNMLFSCPLSISARKSLAGTTRQEPLSAMAMEGLQNYFVIRDWGERNMAGGRELDSSQQKRPTGLCPGCSQ